MILLRQKTFTDDVGVAVVGGSALALGGGKLLDYGKSKYHNYIAQAAPPKLDYSGMKFSLGDIVSAERHGGLYSHYGVVVGFDPNHKPIIANYVNKGPLDPRAAMATKSSLEEFAENSILHIEKPNGRFTPTQIVQRANDAIARGNGQYSIAYNNCEHFARDIANGTHTSTQVNKVRNETLGRIMRKGRKIYQKRFAVPATTLLKDQANHLISTKGFDARKLLTKDLGGLSNFSRYQTTYLTTGGSVLGGLGGGAIESRRAKKDAKRYGLQEGTLEYDNYIRQRRNQGIIAGAGTGAALGFGGSKATDFARGKIIADRQRAKGMDLGNNYFGLGKTFRGVRSDADIDKVVSNWKELGDYGKGVAQAIFRPYKGPVEQVSQQVPIITAPPVKPQITNGSGSVLMLPPSSTTPQITNGGGSVLMLPAPSKQPRGGSGGGRRRGRKKKK